MNQIPEALRPLEAYPQFILWKLIPSRTRPGKIDKVPVDPQSGYPRDPHDPAAWLTGADAVAAAALTGFGVGFVFTENDPFFFLDIDNCLENGSWSPLALELLASLPGAAVEVSQSGTGLHIIAQTSPLVHGCKNEPLGLELYTAKRFVALTGTQAQGTAALDQTANLAPVAARYFPASAVVDPATEWTNEPAAGWAGPEDDDELIKRALRSRSGASTFGTRCTFADLWRADMDALIGSYPTKNDHSPYGESEADAALAQHLAFWTGGDCDRIWRLMWKSALVREKWTAHNSYLYRTITGAVGRQAVQGSYYVKRAARKRLEKADPVLSAVSPERVVGYQYLGADQQIEFFAGCVYVQNIHRIFTPAGALLKSEQFNATYGGYEFEFVEKGKTTKKAFEAFTESQVVRFPKAESICFRPELQPGAIVIEESRRLVNVYVPIETPRLEGDPSPFLLHLTKLLPDENDRAIFLAYLAAVVQYPGVKFQWAPLVQGTEGNGKTLFTRCVAYAVGSRYTHLPNARDIDNKFNGWISGKLFIGVEDVFVTDDRQGVLEALKPLITNDRIEIQAKGRDQITEDNRANFVLNTNHRNAIRKTRNDRRFAVFFTAQQSADDLIRDGMNGEYFPQLYDWLRAGGYAVVADFLQRYPIPDDLNPATHCHRAPLTSTTAAAVSESLGSIEQEIMEAVDEGRDGFAGGWISSMKLEQLLLSMRANRAIPRNRRREVLKEMGYDWHPALPGGRVPNQLVLEGGKPRLFILMDHPDAQLKTPGEVVVAYERAQLGDGLKDPSGFLERKVQP